MELALQRSFGTLISAKKEHILIDASSKRKGGTLLMYLCKIEEEAAYSIH